MSLFRYINEEAINPDLKCSICSKPFEEPWAHLNCDRIFCFACINKVEFLCPFCKNNKNKYEFFLLKVKAIANFLNDLPIRCTQCDLQMKRIEFEPHLKTNCKEKIVKQEPIICKEEAIMTNGNTPAQPNQLKRKFEDAFENSFMDCPYGCPEKIKKGRFENHLVICLEKPVDCEAADYGCIEKIRIKNMEQHARQCEFMQMIEFFKNVETLNNEYYDKILSFGKESKNFSVPNYPYASAFVNRLKKSFACEKKQLQKKMKNFYVSNLGMLAGKNFEP